MNSVTYTYKAQVVNWVDGDTVDLRVDLGFRMWAETRFRLASIDTPERGQPNWAEATAKARELAPVGSAVIIQTFKSADKYGRWLVEIWNPEGQEINSTLVELGLAKAYM